MRFENRPCGYATAFAPGLTDPAIMAPQDVISASGTGVVKRYNVYRNNVTVSLIDALAAIYPAIQRITGVEFFRAMARFHARFNAGFDRFREFYDWLLAAIMRRRLLTPAVACAIVAGAAILSLHVGRDFFPQVDAGLIQLHVRAPARTRIRRRRERKQGQWRGDAARRDRE